MDSFSWADNFRAAVGTCLPCFASSGRSPSDSEDETSRAGAIGRQTRFDELEGLLGDADDADTMSLHSNIGQGQQNRRKKRRARKNIQLFGFNLFGRPPIQLPDSDDEGSVNSLRRRRLDLGLNSSAHSSSSGSAFDEDAAPLDLADISRLTAQDAAARAVDLARVRQIEEERRKDEREEREERRRRRKERKELKRVADAIAHSATMSLDGEEFEGFQGSGEFASPTVLPVIHQPLYAQGALIEEFGPYVGSAVPPSGHADDPADADADFGGEVYVRRQRNHGSDSSRSQTRSRSSASQSIAGSSQGYKHQSDTNSPVTHAQSPSAQGFEISAASARKSKKKRPQSISHISSPPTSQSASLPSLDSPVATTAPLAEPQVIAGDGPAYSPLHSSSTIAAMQTNKFPIVGFGGMRRMDSAGSGAFLANRGDA